MTADLRAKLLVTVMTCRSQQQTCALMHTHTHRHAWSRRRTHTHTQDSWVIMSWYLQPLYASPSAAFNSPLWPPFLRLKRVRVRAELLSVWHHLVVFMHLCSLQIIKACEVCPNQAYGATAAKNADVLTVVRAIRVLLWPERTDVFVPGGYVISHTARQQLCEQHNWAGEKKGIQNTWFPIVFQYSVHRDSSCFGVTAAILRT